MPTTELLKLVDDKELDAFENRCLELLTAGELRLKELRVPFEHLLAAGHGARVGPLAQMVFENQPAGADPEAALALARLAITADPKNTELRNRAIESYRSVYGQTPRFEAALAASGLAGARPAPAALRFLDVCLPLRPGAALLSRLDSRVAEVANVDEERLLFTVRDEGRARTLPAGELVREYDTVDPNDFRVLRQLQPDRLRELIETDPVTVVIGLIHAHGERIDSDQLKDQLVPQHIAPKDWSRWWTGARAALKRSPHVIIEGRSPMLLSYSAEGRSLEDEVREELESLRDALKWQALIEGYLREKAGRKEKPDPELLAHCHLHIANYIGQIRALRPAEALACSLVLGRLAERGVPVPAESQALAPELLRAAADPVELIRQLGHDSLWERALGALREARPADWPERAVALLRHAPAGPLDTLAQALLETGQSGAVQELIDEAVADPAHYPEAIYWLWKGPAALAGVRLPDTDELLTAILNTLSALGRTLDLDAEVTRAFRHRMRAALAVKSFARVREYLRNTEQSRAVTLRAQLLRMEGLGENVPAQLLDLLRDTHPELWIKRERKLEPWEDAEVLWTTPGGLRRKTAERDELVNVKMRENAKRIGAAAALGDLSENSEYKFALEERDFLRGMLAQMNGQLSLARVLEEHQVPHDRVGVGSRVRLRRVPDGPERTITFLGPFETDVEQGIYNYQAPFAQGLMGRCSGERVRATLDGAEADYEIVAVESGLGSPG